MGRKRASEAREGALDETASPIKKSRATATTPPASPKKDSTPAKDVKSLNAVDSVAYSELPAQASVSATGRLAKIMTWNVAGLRGTLKKCPDILKTLSKVTLLRILLIVLPNRSVFCNRSTTWTFCAFKRRRYQLNKLAPKSATTSFQDIEPTGAHL